MSTEKPALDPKAAMASIRSLLDTVEPRAEVQIQDALGNEYRVRTTLPARRQIRALRGLEEAMELAWGMEVSTEDLGDGDKGGKMLRLVKAALSREDILEKVAEAFGEAYPDTVEKARTASREAGENATNPADLFPVEALADALFPLLVRLARKIMGTMATAVEKTRPATQPGT